MSHTLEIASPRPQKPPSSYARILTWQESDLLPLSSGTTSAGQYYSDTKRHEAHPLSSFFSRFQPWASHVVEGRLLNAALILTALLDRAPPPPPPPPSAPSMPLLPTRVTIRDKLAEGTQRAAMAPIGTGRPIPTGEASSDEGTETFIGRDGTHWPMPPKECRPSGGWASVATTISKCSETSSSPSSLVSATTPEYSSTEDELDTPPPPQSSAPSLAELGRDWYSSFGQELGARPPDGRSSGWNMPLTTGAMRGLQHLDPVVGGDGGHLAHFGLEKGADAGTTFFIGRDGNHWPLPPDECVPWHVP
ncbi:hypothetical protein OH77DRAFT_1514843 [Trametes cingulata]|nr:hypothetical protein OH77DRAFT_1514843 [Trametes cingulata]